MTDLELANIAAIIELGDVTVEEIQSLERYLDEGDEAQEEQG